MRTRSGADLIDDVLKRSDNEGATDRHPRSDVLRAVNQGGAELWDLLIAARGEAYFQADPSHTFTTVANTSDYTLPAAVRSLIGVRFDGDDGQSLRSFDGTVEPALRDATLVNGGPPTSYRLRRVGAGTQKLVILPLHQAGLSIVVDYVPAFVDLTDSDASLFDGINGWEEYIVAFAARTLAVRDEEWPLAKSLEGEMMRLKERINLLAPKQDLGGPRRVKDVRGPRVFARRWW